MAPIIDYRPESTAPPWGTIIQTMPEVCPHCGQRLWRYGDPPATTTTFKFTITVPVEAMRADDV